MSSAGRLIALGDIHGCAHALDALLDAIRPQPNDRIVCLGDFVDQGRDTRDVIERLIALERQCQLITIEGNHEEMMLAARDNEQALRYWENCGGVATLNSYRFGATLADIPPRHWQFIEACRPYYATDDFIFCHANCDPALPLAEQPVHICRWEIFDPSEARWHLSGKPFVVGHTEHPDGEIIDVGCAIAIDTACWRYGWLTAIDLHTRHIWQASRWGMLRESDEPPLLGRLELSR